MIENHIEEKTLFNQTLAILKQKLVSFHDEKVKSESFINEDYLEYLALKYTSKTFTSICNTYDTNALETIINHI